MDDIIRILADELGKKPEHIENVIKLIDECFVYHALRADALFFFFAVDYHLLCAGEHGEDKLDAL